jgi:2-polyprenyl-3-methyl-5-hydroxy-6-metoxy-1,4-benzoquinol methylase
MLQLHALNRSILDAPSFRATFDGPPARGPALEDHVDAAIHWLRASRSARAREEGGLTRLGATLDAALRTDAVEHMDDPAYPERGKLAIALGLHLLNVSTFAYRRFFTLLAPLLREASARHGRPARVLELAGGSGGFALALASLARRSGLDVEVTGSDIVPLYVERAREEAKRARVPVTYQRLDALDMASVEDGAYDVVFIGQSTHHFSAGKIGRMIAEAKRVATSAFVSVDGYRSLGMVAFVSGTALLTMWPAMVHDATISARRFYGEDELAAIARLAAPRASVTLGRIWPLMTTLTVRFDGAA